jgi:hypothetical protein
MKDRIILPQLRLYFDVNPHNATTFQVQYNNIPTGIAAASFSPA